MPKLSSRETGRYVFNGGDSPESRNTELNPLYSTWKTLVSRCTNPRDNSFQYYGKAGITIAEPWLRDFDQFKADILAQLGPRPAGFVLGRVDVTKGYETGNVKWSAQGEQTRKRKGVKLNAENAAEIRDLAGTMSCGVIAKQFGIHQSHISRILNGKRWEDVGVSPVDQGEQLAQLVRQSTKSKK